MSNFAPIVFFCYNRADKTKNVLEKLAENNLANQSELFIFSDGPKCKEGTKKINDIRKVIRIITHFKNIQKYKKDIKKVSDVRKVIRLITGFKKIHINERKKNFGLVESIITGVSEIINKYGSVIVLEDDVITSKHFLEFMNDCLHFYKNDKKVFSITGLTEPRLKVPSSYKNDIFLFPYRFYGWGWATWKDRWNKIDFQVKDYDKFKKDLVARNEFIKGGRDLFNDLKLQMEGKLNTWDGRASYGEFKNNGYTLISIKNHVKNIGADSSGTHGSAIGYPLQIIDDNNYKKPYLIESSEILKTNQIMVEENNKAIDKILNRNLNIYPVWKKVLKNVLKKFYIKSFRK